MYRLKRPLFLASASPRRRELLTRFGIPFTLLPSPGDASLTAAMPASRLCRRLAEEKALAASLAVTKGIVMGFDTLVYSRGKILEKPSTASQARQMLQRLSGREHIVYSGMAIVLRPENTLRSAFQTTRVAFRRLTTREINKYIKTREPFDKAGAYGIQGNAGVFVSGIHGCFFNVAGLPVSLLMKFLKPHLTVRT